MFHLYDHLAETLTYPGPDLRRHAEALCRNEFLEPEEYERIHAFCVYTLVARSVEAEELFTRTFDLNPDCCLETGWHLFGEDYERGAFLVNMRQALREKDLEETVELPDHISHCLRLLAWLDPEDAGLFTRKFLYPALLRILGAMSPDNPYTELLLGLRKILERHYGLNEGEIETSKMKIIKLPMLNTALYYDNTEDSDGLNRMSRK